MSYRIFTLSPGSTSTKLAVFNGTEQVFKANVQHDPEVLKTFARVSQQKPYRVETILNLLKENGIDIADMDAAVGSGGVNLYTFRNFVNFFLGFGWSAVLLGRSIPSKGLLLLISVLVGVAFVALVMWLFKWLYSMQQTGNINVYKSAVGCTGTVYLPIPAERGGEGKVQITIQGAVREYNALTEGEALPTGKPIKVVEVINPGTLLVEPLDSLII